MGAECGKIVGISHHSEGRKGRDRAGGQVPHILILGPTGSGKTTLLYRTIFPQWENITSQMRPTEGGFHYEETVLGGCRVGFWEVAGWLEDMWPLFYQSMRFDALVYVVSMLETDSESTDKARRWITRLSNEEELRGAPISLVLNTFDADQVEGLDKDQIASRFGVLPSQMPSDPNRFCVVRANAKNGTLDKEWQSLLEMIIRQSTTHRRLRL